MELIGQVIGNYRIEAYLGAGGMGVVYRGRHIHLDREAAIKVMHPHLAIDPNFRSRFHREARAAAALDHPHIIHTIEFGEQDGRLYLVMELVPDGSIRRLFPAAQHDAQALQAGLALIRQAADGLAYAHARGMVHRDVKPDNLLLIASGETVAVRVCDFGLARLAEGSVLTGSGLMLGTPAYMSPEQCQGQEAVPASDQYALGVVLYELVTGRVPSSPSPSSTPPTSSVRTHPPPSTFRPDIAPELEALILRCLAKTPEERFADTGELVTALKAVAPGDVRLDVFSGNTTATDEPAAISPSTLSPTDTYPSPLVGREPDWSESATAELEAGGNSTFAETPRGYRVHTDEPTPVLVARRRRRSMMLFGFGAAIAVVLVIAAVVAMLLNDGNGAQAGSGSGLTSTPSVTDQGAPSDQHAGIVRCHHTDGHSDVYGIASCSPQGSPARATSTTTRIATSTVSSTSTTTPGSLQRLLYRQRLSR